MTDADQRAAIIRDLDKAARDAGSHVAFLRRKWRELMESDDPDMPARDAVAAENGIEEAMSGMSEARRVLAKRARLLDGPPPSLMLRATGDPGHLDIIARTPDADLPVGYAVRSGSGDRESWRLCLTEIGSSRSTRIRGSIGIPYPAVPEELLEALNRSMDDHGPWWARQGRNDG